MEGAEEKKNKVPAMPEMKLLVTHSCLILCDHMDCSPPGSSVHGILQARILKWVAVPFSGERVGSYFPKIERDSYLVKISDQLCKL